jgi:hypothetical protein
MKVRGVGAFTNDDDRRTMMDNMKPFTDIDWDCFAGCEGESPHIGYFEIDGHQFTVVTDDLGVEISWHVPHDVCEDHFARKDWNEVEKNTCMASDYYVEYANGILEVAERSATVQEVMTKCGLEQCQ